MTYSEHALLVIGAMLAVQELAARRGHRARARARAVKLHPAGGPR